MRYQVVVITGLLAASLGAQAPAPGAARGLPVRNGRPVVAVVDTETISLDELVLQLGEGADRAQLRQGRGTPDAIAVVDRLVNIKLIVREASRMGLDEAPEIRKQVEVTSREIMREVLVERLVKDAKPEPAAVEKVFRELVREWRTTSLLFQDQAAAERARKELAAGASFDAVAAKAAAAKTAKTDGDAAYHARKDYLPQIGDAVAKLKAGQVSPVIRLPAGFVIVKVLDIRHPENAAARSKARQQVLSQTQAAIVAAHEQSLKRQYLVVNEAVLKAVDYEAAKPGIDALLKDKRVIAEIKGAAPLTVGDLTEYLRLQVFHGEDQAGQGRRMNARKQAALDATLGRRLLNVEALKLGIDKTNAYRDRVRGFEESLVFDRFVEKVVAPESKLRQEDVSQHYKANLKDYSSPEMYRLRSLAFSRKTGADAALRQAKDGAAWNWLAANAEGQVDKAARGVLVLDGRPVTTESMPDAMQRALRGAKAGDLRQYASAEGYFYVLSVQQVIAPVARPFDEVKDDIAKKMYGEKLNKNLEAYAGKLRAHSKIETYLKRIR
jgi:parvulin-like peptidyl-prolyl isomerase